MFIPTDGHVQHGQFPFIDNSHVPVDAYHAVRDFERPFVPIEETLLVEKGPDFVQCCGQGFFGSEQEFHAPAVPLLPLIET
jgi:hypothetical protein